MSYSYSKIRTYLYCPRRYKYHYIDGIKSETSDIMESGTAIHKAIQEQNEVYVLDNIENYVMYRNALDYLKFVKPIEYEVKLGITENFEPVGFDNAWFHGIIDLIYYGGILDWKTGQSKPDALQILLNGMLAKIHGYEVNEVTYVYLHSGTYSTVQFTEETFENIKQTLKSLVKQIENDNEYKANPSHKCYYCPFAEICADSFDIEKPEEKLKKLVVLQEYTKRLNDELKDYIKETSKPVMTDSIQMVQEKKVYYRCQDKELLKQKLKEMGVFENIAEVPSTYYENLYKEHGFDDVLKPYIRSNIKIKA